MSKYSATILIVKDTVGEPKYKYKFKELKSDQEPFFKFLFRVLQRDANHLSRWTPDNQIAEGCKIRINIYTPNEIINQKNLNKAIPFGQGTLMGVNEKIPIIHLVLNDFLNNCPHTESEKLHRLIPRYFQIIDSSIWNHYVPMVKFDKSSDSFYSFFSNAINEIYDNYTNGVYKIEVAGEFADINARILQQSYLTGHHGTGVAPFIFHSEGYIKNLIDDKLKSNRNINRICERKWRFLLVDDKAESPMAPFDDMTRFDEVKKEYLVTKFKIIKNRLESTFNDYPNFMIFDNKEQVNDNRNGIMIESVCSIDEAKKALQNKEYDIILLDYLLDKGKGGGYEYGYDLLNEINNDKSKYEHYIIGPRDCFYFMFISAYPTAVQERLLAEGLNQHERYWNINVGACPTNTPQLFLYNLLKFMYRRMERLGIDKLSYEEILKLILEIFNPEDGNTVREMADEKYRDVLSLQYHYRRMLSDVDIPENGGNVFNNKKSVLVTDFIQQNDWLGGFLEHLSHLVYLVAFGTTQQWVEMWEEYLYIRPHLAQIESPSEKEKEEEGIKKEYVSKWIEDYISKLKRQQR
jgi:hypothetical protein